MAMVIVDSRVKGNVEVPKVEKRKLNDCVLLTFAWSGALKPQKTPEFEVGGTVWSLGISSDANRHLECDIRHLGTDSVFGDLNVYILDEHGCSTYKACIDSNTVSLEFGHDHFTVDQWKLISEKEYKWLNCASLGNKLVLQITFCRLDKLKVTNVPSLTANNLAEDMSVLFDNSHLSDCTVICNADVFPVHKVILSARSEVFNAMINSQMSESLTNEIAISDFDSRIVKDMLKYIYTDKCEESVLEMHCNDLCAIATKYQIHGLVTLCENYMQETLSHTNAVERLLFADIYSPERLKHAVLNYIADNYREIRRVEVDFLSRLSSTLKDDVLNILAR